MQTHSLNTVEIFNSKFDYNGLVGINCLGEESQPQIYQNLIENNAGSGIIVGTSNKAKIIRNMIKLNVNGIECISSNPLIQHNKIHKNIENGVYTHCFENFR
jgi:hypothetical protein